MKCHRDRGLFSTLSAVSTRLRDLEPRDLLLKKVRFALILEDASIVTHSTDTAREALYIYIYIHHSLQGNFSVKPLEFPLWNLVPKMKKKRKKKKKKKGNTRARSN